MPAPPRGTSAARIKNTSASVALLKFIHHAIQIGITGAETPGEPVTAALGNGFSISDYIELTRVAGCNYRVNAQALLDHGHETRDLGLIVPSSWAGTYFNLHCGLQTACTGR